MDLLKEIENLKAAIEVLRPLPKDLEARIMQKFRLDWNYHSNSIEGNQLTFGETKTFLLHGITADGKPLKDHLDIRGHNEALLLLEDIIKEERPITESFIRELHKMILQENYYNKAVTPNGQPTRRLIEVGKYKQAPNHVKTATGEIFFFASPEETPAEMDKLIQWLRAEQEKGDLHPVILATYFHYKFIRIHPFDDGNGRLARILMNLLLMRHGFLPAVVKVEQKEAYYKALRKADGGDEMAFVAYITTIVKDSLDLYLKGAKGESIEEVSDFDKKLMLFKKGFKNEKQKKTKNNETLSKIYKTSIKPLILKINELKGKFSDLFNSTNNPFIPVRGSLGVIELGDNFFSIRNYDDFEEKIYTTLEYQRDYFSVSYVLNRYKYKTSLSYKIKLGIEFNEYDYCISLNMKLTVFNSYKLKLKKEYHQFITEEEQNKIISDLGNALLEQLKKDTPT